MSLPLLSITQVTHLGFMRDRPAPKFSHEGRCLSVSLHPDAWRRIARLGDSPTWRLENHHGRFVDFHALTSEHHQSAMAWALDKGWLCEQWLYRVALTDENGDAEGYMISDTFEEALSEADGEEDRITKVKGYTPCDAMHKALGITVPLGAAESWAIIEWLSETSGSDGIWWNDILDPSSLSAPRGGIFQHRVQHWSKTCLAQS